MASNPTFYGLTAKIEIPDIYSVDDIQEFQENLTPEENQKYNQNCEKIYQNLTEMINKFSSKQNQILGYQYYEKKYPENENLFEDVEESESGDNLVGTP